jgi:hypothetical protein
MDIKEPPTFTYKQFCDFTGAFDAVKLLAAVARLALQVPERAGEAEYSRTPPWALAALVRASICHRKRKKSRSVRTAKIIRGCQMYINLKPEELDHPELASALGVLVRTSYEQFTYQESIFEELARVEALFGGYSGRKALEVLSESAIAELYGAPLQQAVGVAFLLHTSAMVNAGYFDLAWLSQPNFEEILKILPAKTVTAVINAAFANTFEEFRASAAKAPALPYLSKYMFNPLTARPLVRLPDGQFVAPVPQLIAKRMSPLEFYYAGLERWGVSFTNDLGEIFEDYVGRQLNTLPDAVVLPEIQYLEGKAQLKSVDWIVIFEDVVILVEAKATRVPAGARAASTALEASIDSTLGKAIKQINRTVAAIKAGVSEFSGIPVDRPMIGMIATLDSWYWSNSPFMRDQLPTPAIPTSIASSRQLEILVAIGQRLSAGKVLKEILDDEEKRSWQLGSALNSYSQQDDKNPLLLAAWQQYPFGDKEVP